MIFFILLFCLVFIFVNVLLFFGFFSDGGGVVVGFLGVFFCLFFKFIHVIRIVYLKIN